MGEKEPKALLGDISNVNAFRVPDLPNKIQPPIRKKLSKAEIIEQKKISMLRRLENNKRLREAQKEGTVTSLSNVDLRATEETFLQMNVPEPLRPTGAFTCGPAVEFSDISAIHGDSFRHSIEPSKVCFMTSTPSRSKKAESAVNPATPTLNQTTFSYETVDERLQRQMEALSVWCNMILKTTSEFDELDLGKTKQDASKKLQELLNGKPFVDSKLLKKNTYKDFLRSQERSILRKGASEIFSATGALRTISDVVMKDGLSIMDTCSVHNELNLKERLLHIFLSFHPAWLHLGLETVFNEEIHIPEGSSWTLILSHFISSRLFTNPAMLRNKKFANGDVWKIITPVGRLALHRHFLIYSSSFFYAAELLKSSGVIKHDPPLFARGSKFMCLDDVFSAMSKECLSGSGMTLGKMFSSKLGFKPVYKQGFLDNYDYTVNGFENLMDGIIFGKLVEITSGAKSGVVMRKLRNPGGDRLRKVGNVKTVLGESKILKLNVDDVKAEEIVGGKKNSILGFLWKIIGVYILTNEADHLRRESLALQKSGPGGSSEIALHETPESTVLRICRQIGDFASLKVNSPADLTDGMVLALAWRMYNPDAPDVNFYNGKTLFDKVVEAAQTELDVPVGISGSIILFAHLYLSRLFHQKKMKDAAMRIQRAYRGFRCLKMMRCVLEHISSSRCAGGRESVSSVCSLQRTHIVENPTIFCNKPDLPSLIEDDASNTFVGSEPNTFLAEFQENEAAQTLLLLGSSTSDTYSAENLNDQLLMKDTRVRATITIQAAYRGYQQRLLYTELLENNRQRFNRAVITVQAYIRGFLARNNLQKAKLFSIQNNAATKIQASFRGFHGRMKYRALCLAREEYNQKKLNIAATVLQAYIRGYLARKQFSELVHERSRQNLAATKIQSVFRGFLDRKLWRTMLAIREENNREKFRHAVLVLQANVRGYLARKQFKKFKHELFQREKAATKIQAAFRGFYIRKLFGKMMEAEKKETHDRRERTLVLLQAHIRGFLARKALDQAQNEILLQVNADKTSSSTLETVPSALNEAMHQSSCTSLVEDHHVVLSVRHIYEEIKKEKRLLQRYRKCLNGIKKAVQPDVIYRDPNSAAVIIQKWFRGYITRKQHAHDIERLQQFVASYARRIQTEGTTDSQSSLNDPSMPATERLKKASEQLFGNNVYGIKVAAYTINRLTELYSEALVQFVCTLEGFGALLDRLEACDRGPALEEIACIVLNTLRRIVESRHDVIEQSVLQYGNDCARILLHCILAYYKSPLIVENIGETLLSLYRHQDLNTAFVKAPFYLKELTKKFGKLPNADARVLMLKKMKSKLE